MAITHDMRIWLSISAYKSIFFKPVILCSTLLVDLWTNSHAGTLVFTLHISFCLQFFYAPFVLPLPSLPPWENRFFPMATVHWGQFRGFQTVLSKCDRHAGHVAEWTDQRARLSGSCGRSNAWRLSEIPASFSGKLFVFIAMPNGYASITLRLFYDYSFMFTVCIYVSHMQWIFSTCLSDFVLGI